MKFDVHTGEAVAGGEDAVAPPKYWDDVKDPTVVEYFRITSKTHADEYERVLGAFMLTLDPSAFQCINQIGRPRLLEPGGLEDLRGETCRDVLCARGRPEIRRRSCTEPFALEDLIYAKRA